MNVTITGNTYKAKSVLSAAGFAYDAKNKCWTGTQAELTELKRISTASYSVANRNAIAGIVITENIYRNGVSK